MVRLTGDKRQCSKCKQWQDRSQFTKNRRSADGLDYRCKTCTRDYSLSVAEEKSKQGKAKRAAQKKQAWRYQTTEERFWSKVDRTCDCWLWEAGCHTTGYGAFTVGNNVHMQAHRFSYELTYGPIPAGLFVCHRCDNPRCVNPSHLFLGTALDNNRDASQKGRSARGDRNGSRTHIHTRPRGESHASTKITLEKANAIRTRHTQGITIAQIAREMHLSESTVRNVVKERSWLDR